MTEPPAAPIDEGSGVAAVILAAGASTRFGSPKQLARVSERPMLQAVVELARVAGLDPILAVVPGWLTLPAGVIRVPNDEPERGISHSLQLGIDAVPGEVGAAVVLLGDQPTLPAASVQALLAARGLRAVVAASFDGLVLPPVLLERSAFGMVDGLEGDIGLRELIRGEPTLVATVALAAMPLDVDTPADLELL
jgi:molybdenum cofactor cytidylyltransferase